MELIVVGTGSDGNAYLLDNGEEALLIECGVPMAKIKQAINFNIGKIVGCIVTHEHQDHCKSIEDVLACGIKVRCSEGTIGAIKFKGIRRPKAIKAKQECRIGGFRIMPFDVKHDVAEPFGYLIEHKDCGRVLFLTDTHYSKYTFPGLNNIIIEANYGKEIIDRKLAPDSDMGFLRKRIMKSHMSIETCVDMLKANDLSAVNNIILIHLSNGNSDERQFIEEVKKATGIPNVYAADKNNKFQLSKTPY
jgi:phosphoribosyl 1,2-cyclic phosphodiesterase